MNIKNMAVPNPIWLYRITHINNLEHDLEHGVVNAKSEHANPNYIQIGDSSLIDIRKEIEAPYPPGGILSDYIPFLFGTKISYALSNSYRLGRHSKIFPGGNNLLYQLFACY